jgi:hypothetical protein
MQRDLLRLQAEMTSALSGLDVSHMQATPTGLPEKWTIQQIAEHLIQTYDSSVASIQTRVEKRRPTGASPTLTQRGAQFVVLSLGYLPSGREAPASVLPSRDSSPMSGLELTQRLAIALQRLAAVTADAEDVFGSRRAVSHMILGPLSMQQWCRFHLVHGRLHARQIGRIRRDHSF